MSYAIPSSLPSLKCSFHNIFHHSMFISEYLNAIIHNSHGYTMIYHLNTVSSNEFRGERRAHQLAGAPECPHPQDKLVRLMHMHQIKSLVKWSIQNAGHAPQCTWLRSYRNSIADEVLDKQCAGTPSASIVWSWALTEYWPPGAGSAFER